MVRYDIVGEYIASTHQLLSYSHTNIYVYSHLLGYLDKSLRAQKMRQKDIGTAGKRVFEHCGDSPIPCGDGADA